jgi:hypothetical protein
MRGLSKSALSELSSFPVFKTVVYISNAALRAPRGLMRKEHLPEDDDPGFKKVNGKVMLQICCSEAARSTCASVSAVVVLPHQA